LSRPYGQLVNKKPKTGVFDEMVNIPEFSTSEREKIPLYQHNANYYLFIVDCQYLWRLYAYI